MRKRPRSNDQAARASLQSPILSKSARKTPRPKDHDRPPRPTAPPKDPPAAPAAPLSAAGDALSTNPRRTPQPPFPPPTPLFPQLIAQRQIHGEGRGEGGRNVRRGGRKGLIRKGRGGTRGTPGRGRRESRWPTWRRSDAAGARRAAAWNRSLRSRGWSSPPPPVAATPDAVGFRLGAAPDRGRRQAAHRRERPRRALATRGRAGPPRRGSARLRRPLGGS